MDYTPFQIGKCYLCRSPHVYLEDLRRYGGLVCFDCGEALIAHHHGGHTFFWRDQWLEAYGLRV